MKLLESVLKTFVASGSEVNPSYSEDLQEIEEVLEELPPEEAKTLAALAMVLGRVAYADNEISDKEKSRMADILEKHFKLSKPKARVVMSLAVTKNLELSLDHHIVLRRLNEALSSEEKKQLIRTLFELASVDDVSTQESGEIRKISLSLLLSEADYFQVQSEFREKLSILKTSFPD